MNRTSKKLGKGGTVKVTKRRSFSAIPDDILEDKRMRTETRLVLGWLVGRPNGWIIRVRHVMAALGLSEGRWKTSRQEMEKYGYLQQVRKGTEEGTFLWEHDVTDTPILPKNAIGEFSTDGSSTGGKPTDLTSSHNQEDLNTSLNGSVAITQVCFEQARQMFSGYDIHILETKWQSWIKITNKPFPKSSDQAFLAWAKTYTKHHPLPYGGTL